MPNIRQWINKLYYAPKIPFQQTPLGFYIGMFEKREYFSFSRFGDGEWSSIIGKSGANCDEHHYFPEMATRLQNTVIHSHPYFYGIQNFAIKNMGRQIYGFLKKNRVTRQWHNSDVFNYANIAIANRSSFFKNWIRYVRNITFAVILPRS